MPAGDPERDDSQGREVRELTPVASAVGVVALHPLAGGRNATRASCGARMWFLVGWLEAGVVLRVGRGAWSTKPVRQGRASQQTRRPRISNC